MQGEILLVISGARYDFLLTASGMKLRDNVRRTRLRQKNKTRETQHQKGLIDLHVN